MIESPFHPRTSALCRSYRWKDWAGYTAVCSYDTCHEREYFAFRQSCGLIDVTPLFKYDVKGPDAGAFLSRVMTRDVSKLRINRVGYTCWTDAKGRLLDDGTVTRLDKHHYRVTAADPAYRWFSRHTRGYDVTVEDTSRQIAALALQGPTSRSVLDEVTEGAVEKLRFFRSTKAKIAGAEVTITRTGFTGDLGYEIWMANGDALKIWDALIGAGRRYALEPAGLDALDVTRLEAGFILAGVDYAPATGCLTPDQMSTPYEVDLGWAVQLDRAPFIGQDALKAEKARGHAWATVGVEISWEDIERVYAEQNLPPSLPSAAWRGVVPLVDGDRQIGYATSGTWSPLLKKYIALATVPARYEAIGTKLGFEIMAQFWRKTVGAKVVEKPFFNPPRKRS